MAPSFGKTKTRQRSVHVSYQGKSQKSYSLNNMRSAMVANPYRRVGPAAATGRRSMKVITRGRLTQTHVKVYTTKTTFNRETGKGKYKTKLYGSTDLTTRHQVRQFNKAHSGTFTRQPTQARHRRTFFARDSQGRFK